VVAIDIRQIKEMPWLPGMTLEPSQASGFFPLLANTFQAVV
jgi:hypothetical protein